MSELQRSTHQLASLQRLSAMKKTKAAVYLAQVQNELNFAEQEKQHHQAQFLLAQQVLRQSRQQGVLINPCYYREYLQVSDVLNMRFTQSAECLVEIKEQWQQANADFIQKHSQYKVAQKVFSEQQILWQQQCQRIAWLDSQTEQGS